MVFVSVRPPKLPGVSLDLLFWPQFEVLHVHDFLNIIIASSSTWAIGRVILEGVHSLSLYQKGHSTFTMYP